MARTKGSAKEVKNKSTKKPVKKPSIKLAKSEKKAGKTGHNSGVNQPLVDLFDEAIALGKKQKELGKAIRDIRNKAKTEHGVISAVFQHELKLRKMDRDFRIQFESGHHDIKKALGYQLSLDLAEDTVARTEDEHLDPSLIADRLTGRTSAAE